MAQLQEPRTPLYPAIDPDRHRATLASAVVAELEAEIVKLGWPVGSVIATAEICDRLESTVDAGVPNFTLAEYPAPENHRAAACPLCQAGVPITTF